jgi:hypothetical protein
MTQSKSRGVWEQVGDNRPKQLEDRKHRSDDALILRTNPRGWNFRERQRSHTDV